MISRILLLLYFLLNSCAVYASEFWFLPSVHYKINRDAKGEVVMTMRFQGGASGKTAVWLPDNQRLQPITATSVHGSKVVLGALRRTDITIPSQKPYEGYTCMLKHKPRAEIEVSYRLTENLGSYASENHVVLIGSRSFAIPMFANKNDLQEYKYQNIVVDGDITNRKYKKFISGATMKDMPVNLCFSDLLNGWFVFSNQDIAQTLYHEPNGDILVLTPGFAKNDKQLFGWHHQNIAQLAHTIANKNLAFIYGNILNKSLAAKNRAIIIVNGAEFKPHWSGCFIQGSALAIANKSTTKKQLASTLSHEILHELFSNMVSADFGVDHKNKHFSFSTWFDEGFTDYYADYLNYRHGIITAKEYLEILNADLAYYQQYGIMQNQALAANVKILETMRDFFNTSFRSYYIIGRLIALDMDNTLKLKSHGQYSLDDFMRKLIADSCRKMPCNITKKQFIKTFEYLTKSHFPERYVDKYIVNLDAMPLPVNLTFPKSHLKYRNIHNGWDYGFDLATSSYRGMVVNVDETSKAYKAGLRDGMVPRFFDFTQVLTMTLKVEKANGEIVDITYPPYGPAKLAYYQLD